MSDLKIYIRFFLFVFVFGILSCTNQTQSPPINKIQYVLDSLKSIYAPDTRISLWNMSITNTSGKTEISSEVDKEKAYHDIINTFSNRFPDVEFKIKLLPLDGNKQLVTGLINNSVANLRSNPRHSAEIATQALLGTPVRVLKRENDWYLIQTPKKYLAWVDAPALVKINSAELSNYKKSKKVIFNKQYGFSYSEPNDKSLPVSDLVIGCILPVVSSINDFFKVQYPDKRMAWVKKDEVSDAEVVFNKHLDGKKLVSTAEKFMGIPYLWGGSSSKGIDCSGFSSIIYFMNGTVLQRDASQQTRYGKEITTNYDYEDLQKGDLLFFGRKASDSLTERVTHVAIYIGDSEFIHASGKVRINSIDSARNNFIPEYVPRFVRAVRVLGETDKDGFQQITENDFYKEIINNQ